MKDYRLCIQNKNKRGRKYHVLLSGTANPNRINGNYLPGTITDITIAEEAIDWTRDNRKCPNILVAKVKDTSLSRGRALETINLPFEKAKSDTESEWISIEIFFSGRGSGGNWCFSNGSQVTLKDILTIAKENSQHFNCLNLVTWACESGKWCQQLKEWEHKINLEVNIYASSWPDRTSCSNINGADWTRFMYKKHIESNSALRWSRASLKKDGTYRMTHMIAYNNVEAQVNATPGKVEKLKMIVEQFDSSGLSEHWNKWFSIPGNTAFQHFDNTFEDVYPEFIKLQTEIDEIQGPSYLKAIKLSTKTTMSTEDYSFIVELGLEWIQDEHKIEWFKNYSLCTSNSVN